MQSHLHAFILIERDNLLKNCPMGLLKGNFSSGQNLDIIFILFQAVSRCSQVKWYSGLYWARFGSHMNLVPFGLYHFIMLQI